MDYWYDADSVVFPSSVAVVNGGVYFGSGFNWTVTGGANRSFGPVNFKYLMGGGPQTSVSITSLSNGANLLAPTNVTLTAAASAGVTNVQFFQGNTKIGEDTTSPFSAVWTNPDPGSYALTARAIANGNTVTSAVVNVTVAVNVSGTETPFVSANSLGNARNDFGGFLGMELVTGPNPFTVTKLGRMMLAGNSQTHVVKLVKGSDGSDVAGGSASVAMAGGTPGQFRYAALASPLILSPNTRYFLVSQETVGGDTYSDVQGTVVTPTSVARVDGGVYGGPPWNTGGLSNRCYVPVSFTYLTGDQPAPSRLAVHTQGGQVRLTIHGQAGQTYRIEATLDFVTWTSIGNFNLTTDSREVQDPSGGSFPRRFYRASLVQ